MLIDIIKAYLKWRDNWDDLCDCCGRCCYIRHVDKDGNVIIDYSAPCVNLDTETHLCRIYPERFEKCAYCGKVGLWTALFNKTLPKDCAYVKTFRLWQD